MGLFFFSLFKYYDCFKSNKANEPSLMGVGGLFDSSNSLSWLLPWVFWSGEPAQAGEGLAGAPCGIEWL